MTRPTIDRTPMTAEQIFDQLPDIEGGLRIIDLGEDGDYAITPGHQDRAEFAKSLTEHHGGDDYDVESIDHTWAIVTTHMPDCEEDLDDDETCSCEDESYGFAWWVTFADDQRYSGKIPAGAIAVTRWSA